MSAICGLFKGRRAPYHHGVRRIGLVMVGVALSGCGSDPAAPGAEGPHPLAACAESPSSPETVVDAIEVINSLPEPTIPCFVANLARPLRVVVSRSQLSAQPAFDDANPRIFLLRDGMAMTVVPEGMGQHLLEFGEWTTPTRTIKAELPFPVTLPVAANAAFERVLLDDQSITGVDSACSVCHHAEQLEMEVDGVNAYSTSAYRPSDKLVSELSTVEVERALCPDDDRSERCDLLRAVVDFGAQEAAFVPDVPTFAE